MGRGESFLDHYQCDEIGPDLSHFGQLFKAHGCNYFAQSANLF